MASPCSTTRATLSLRSRPMRPYPVGSVSRAVSNVAAAPVCRCCATRAATVSLRSSGVSPGSTSKSPDSSRSSSMNADMPTRTASPVPRCTSCSTKPMRSADDPSSCTFFVTASAPCPTTTTVRLTSRPRSDASTWRSIGRPHRRWRGFGRVERIRVPSPAASTMADSVMVLFYQRAGERTVSNRESSRSRRVASTADFDA